MLNEDVVTKELARLRRIEQAAQSVLNAERSGFYTGTREDYERCFDRLEEALRDLPPFSLAIEVV